MAYSYGLCSYGRTTGLRHAAVITPMWLAATILYSYGLCSFGLCSYDHRTWPAASIRHRSTTPISASCFMPVHATQQARACCRILGIGPAFHVVLTVFVLSIRLYIIAIELIVISGAGRAIEAPEPPAGAGTGAEPCAARRP